MLSSSEGIEVEEENEAYPTSGVEEEANVIDEEELVQRFLENQEDLHKINTKQPSLLRRFCILDLSNAVFCDFSFVLYIMGGYSS